jgi:putative ABC transport system ATP-binding protein
VSVERQDLDRAAGRNTDVMIHLDSVTRTFGTGRSEVHALRGISFSVPRGELVAIRGRSGSGKTTLLNLMAGLDRPTAGRIWVAGQEVTAMDREALLRLRRETVSLIFPSFALLPVLSAAENVGLPMRLARMSSAAREQRAAELLELVGLEGRGGQRPLELSGGEQQRVAIARALANNATVLLADEPTGQLDSHMAAQIMDLLRSIVHAEGITAVVATHDATLMDAADRVLVVQNGQLMS